MRSAARLAILARGRVLQGQRMFANALPARVMPRGRALVAGGGVALALAMSVHDEAKAAGVDYGAVRKAIEDILERDDWDDGHLGPVLVRLAWHASGTYNKADGSGGSDGATMRFSPEKDDGANAGLNKARDFLEPIKKQFPGISYADLWILAGVVAIENMGGPKIGFRAGRSDKVAGQCPPVGRLPDATQGAEHLRQVFGRMGFNDQEIVALSGAHTLGRCHADRSGFVGPWTRAPTTFSTEFFRELLENQWTPKKWNGPPQYQDPTGDLMMLPTDLVLIQDPKFRVWVEKYKNDKNLFFKDFAAAYQKLNELGVKFPQGEAQEARSGRFWLITFLTAVGFATVSK